MPPKRPHRHIQGPIVNCCTWLVISLLINLYKVSFKNAVFYCYNWNFRETFNPRVIGNRGESSVGAGACPQMAIFPTAGNSVKNLFT